MSCLIGPSRSCLPQAFMKLMEENARWDQQCCVSQAFGESWASKRERIKEASAQGDQPGWGLVSIIVKSNDDLRQEVGARKRGFSRFGVSCLSPS